MIHSLLLLKLRHEGIRIKMEKKEQQVVVERMPVNAASVESVINESLTRENIATNEVSCRKIRK